MKRIALLGATGSIGGSTLDVIARHPERFQAVALSAHRDVAGLVERCRASGARYAAIADPALEGELARGLRAQGLATRALAGPAALETLATLPEVDTVVAAVVGAAGLGSTLAAAAAGKRVLLANKESVVMAGPLLAAALARGGGTLIPVDSEHNAVFQCLPRAYAGDPQQHGVERIVLTASGGPFRGRTAAELEAVTPDQACAHPKWSMGRKISVDSATLMNKGLEVIEAHHLFGLPRSRIEVVVHPQSIIHSLVAYRDGSLLAQLGNPDMRTAIAHALAYPERVEAGVALLDLAAVAQLSFEAPDLATFRCLALAYAALEAGGTAPAILNAANEVAVDAFLNGAIGFSGIATVVAATLDAVVAGPIATLDDALAADAAARRFAAGSIGRMTG
jgi:1-deoxy-D-xylulose-5-phosphate reductoisomerase